MKKFLVIYLGAEGSAKQAAWEAMEPEARQAKQKEGIAAWQNFMQVNEKAIVDGGPLGKTLKVTEAGVEPVKNQMMAYTIVQAETHESAAEIFRNSPHFTHFPGEAIEVMECIDIPTL